MSYASDHSYSNANLSFVGLCDGLQGAYIFEGFLVLCPATRLRQQLDSDGAEVSG